MRKTAAIVALAAVLGFLWPFPAQAATTITTHQYAADNPDQSLDAYYDPALSGAPWVMVVHGGSWAAGDKSNGKFAAEKFRAQGFQAFSINYRLTTDYGANVGVPWATQLADVSAAWVWIRANASRFGIDPARGAVYGFSAGGHNAMSLALRNPGTVNAVVSASGVLQPHRVVDVSRTPDGGSVVRTLADWEAVAMRCPMITWTDCATRWDQFKPENYITAGDPPVMMFQGTADEAVPSATGTAFKYWLDQKGVESTLVMGTDWGHTELLAFDGGTREANMYKFLKEKTA